MNKTNAYSESDESVDIEHDCVLETKAVMLPITLKSIENLDGL